MSNPTLASEALAMVLRDLNPEQQAAVMAPIDTALQVMAGAGTGKTELINRRFAKLILDLLEEENENPNQITERIWVSTFTEKAAAELKDRISSYLGQAVRLPLSGKAWIGTFHSLCRRLLQQHADKAPHLADFTLLTDIELELLRERLVNTLLEGPPENLPHVLRAENLGVSPDCLSLENLLHLDFMEYETLFYHLVFEVIPQIKAAGLSPHAFYEQSLEQAERFAELIRTMPMTEPHTGTIIADHDGYARQWLSHLTPVSHHRFSFYPTDWEVEIAAEKALQKGKESPAPQKLLIERLKPLYQTKVFVTHDGRKKKEPFSSPSSDLSSLDNALVVERRLIEVTSAVYALYQQLLRQENAFDFDDLIQETVSLLSRHPGVQAHYQSHFAHFMVDEFQDSNGAQLKLMQLLSGTEQPPLTAVGDKKQSIYGFRFAEPENLQLLFEGVANEQRITLHQNYRSTDNILALANRITQMMDLPDDESLRAAKDGAYENTHRPVWLHLDQTTSVAEAKTTETRWIVETIARLLEEGTYTPADIAILVRDHKKAQRLENALDALGIPALKQRNLGFFDCPYIRQAVALLELAEEPSNDLAMTAILQTRLNHRELYLLARQRDDFRQQQASHTLGLYDTMMVLNSNPDTVPPELQPLLPALSALAETLTLFYEKSKQVSPENLFSLILRAFPLVSPQGQETPAGRKATKDLNLLKKMLYHWTERARKPLSLSDILSLLKRQQDRNDLELPLEDETFAESAVRLVTVHGSKGIEYPVVFLAGIDSYRRSRYDGEITVDPQYAGKLGTGLFLNKFQGEKTLKKIIYDTVWKLPRHHEEELRLFYVAMTRAKDRLYISSWPKSFPYQNPVFFRDLPFDSLSENDLIWLEESRATHLAATFRQRYRSAQPLPDAFTFPDFNLTLAPPTRPLSAVPFAVLDAYQQCPTQGILRYRYPMLASKLERSPEPNKIEETLQLNFLTNEANFPSQSTHSIANQKTDYNKLLCDFRRDAALYPALPKPTTDVPCDSCDYQSLCLYRLKATCEVSH